MPCLYSLFTASTGHICLSTWNEFVQYVGLIEKLDCSQYITVLVCSLPFGCVVYFVPHSQCTSTAQFRLQRLVWNQCINSLVLEQEQVFIRILPLVIARTLYYIFKNTREIMNNICWIKMNSFNNLRTPSVKS